MPVGGFPQRVGLPTSVVEARMVLLEYRTNNPGVLVRLQFDLVCRVHI